MANYNNLIHLFDVKTDDTTDYKYTSLQLVFPKCSGKCEGCQNSRLFGKTPNVYKLSDIVDLWNSLNTHKAVVCVGLEPFDSFYELYDIFFSLLKLSNKDFDFVIYTGYEYHEIENHVNSLKYAYNISSMDNKNNVNLIIKYGRYDKNDCHGPYYSSILGVRLSTCNQHVDKYTRTGIEKEYFNGKYHV